MRKILSGFLFRLLKGYDIWVLIAFLLIGTAYIDYQLIDSELGFFCTKEEYEDIEERGYRFNELGVSAHDAYWVYYEPVPQESYDILTNTKTSAPVEPPMFIIALSINVIFPAILMMIFIPVFFGRIFSDGTLKNLVACGFSKVKIYISALVFTCIVDAAVYFIGLFAFAVVCLFARWAPPVYLPVVAPVILVLLLMLFTMSAVSLAALFISYSKIICAIAGFILAVLMVSPVGNNSYYKVYGSYDFEFELSQESNQVYKEQENGISTKFDLSSLIERSYFNGKELNFFKESNLSTGERVASLAIVYMDPYQGASMIWQNNVSTCLLVRDGFMAINAASNVFWISFFTFAGITLFKKRETPC